MTGSLCVMLMLLSCAGFDASDDPGEAELAEEGEAAEAVDPAAASTALSQANEAATLLGKTLKSRILAEMSKGDLMAAAAACADEAQGLTASVRGQTGVTVGRSSLKLRNPANLGPEWVRAWLAAQGPDAAGAKPSSEIAEGPSGKVARVVRPIAVEAPCLACHGPAETYPAELSALLGERYPDDAATGYAAGELRGALWAEVKLPGGS